MPDSSPCVVAVVPPAAEDGDELQPAIAAKHIDAPITASIDLFFIWIAPGSDKGVRGVRRLLFPVAVDDAAEAGEEPEHEDAQDRGREYRAEQDFGVQLIDGGVDEDAEVGRALLEEESADDFTDHGQAGRNPEAGEHG